MADVKFNYKLNIKGILNVKDGNIIISTEDGNEYNLAALCEDFNDKLVKIGVQYDEDYEVSDVD